MTAKKAIQIGQKVVNTPSVILLLLPWAYVLWYFSVREISDIRVLWALLKAMGIGLVLAWTYWSFVASKWLIWAYKKVDNKSELYTRAVKGKLIWKKEHWANKTLIFSKEEKIFVTEIEQSVIYSEDIEPSERTMEFYFHNANFFIFLGLISIFVIGGILHIVEGINENDWKNLCLGIAMSGVGIYGIFKKIPSVPFTPFISFTKKYFSGQSQISINKQGISIRQEHTGLIEWKDVLSFDVKYDSDNNAKKLNFSYCKGEEDIEFTTDLSLLSGDFEEMEYLVRHYRNAVSRSN